MRIGIDISQIVHEGTGVATYTKELVKGLAYQQANKGSNELVLFGASLRRLGILKDFMATLPKKNIRSRIYPMPPSVALPLFNTLPRLPIEWFTGNLDVYQSSDWLEPKASCPKVTVVHDLAMLKFPEVAHPSILATHKNKLRLVKEESSLVIAVSKATKQDLIELLGFKENKIIVIYEAPSEEYKTGIRNTPASKRVLEKYGIEGPYLLAVGTREPRKNLPRIIEGFRRLSNRGLRLVIVGKYGWGPDVVKTDNVYPIGFVPLEDMPALYSSAEAFVYPSLYEGFGLPVLEAMSCETPVVTSNRSSLPEVAGEAAVLVNPLSADEIAVGIKTAMKDRAILTRKGLVQAQKFSWDKTAKETLAVYNQALLLNNGK